jgi:hypothetical protein
MTRRWLLAAAVSLLLPLTGNVWSQTEFFRLADLRPGMKGIGKTCFQGSKPEEFQVEVLGLMRHVTPGGDAVLARFSGGSLSQSGVFEGMSGSPVFIDGKLLGAVAFSFPFAKEAIGGITPIDQMVDAFTEGLAVNNAGPKITLKKSMLWKYEPPEPVGLGLLPGMEVTSQDARLQPALAPFAGHALLPIATPLSLGGFSAETLRAFGPQFRALGFSMLEGSGAAPLQGGSPTSTSASASENPPLEPGSNLVVPLVSGDLDASAGGTVTYINGSKVYAFGHSLFNLGFSQLPLYKGNVLAVVPSLESSFKILEATEPVGALRQDRSMGIYGLIGEHAETIPMRVRMTTSRGINRVWNFQVAEDRFLTPLLIDLTVFETIISTERAMGASTLMVKGKIQLKGEQPIEIENRCTSDSGSTANAAMSIAAPVNFLLTLGYKNLQFEDIDLEISAVEDNRAVSLDSIRVDKTELKAGQTVRVDFFYKKANGELIQDSYPVRIPLDITPGQLSMLVADGTTIMEMDALEEGEELIPRGLPELIKLINDIRKNDRLYVRLFRRAPGAVIYGEGLPGLPPSILSILKSERNTGSMHSLQTLPLMEYELPPSEYVVSGAKLLNLVINP